MCAEQHAAAGIQCDLGLDGQGDAGSFKSQLDAVNGSLDFQNILLGFKQQQIHTAQN